MNFFAILLLIFISEHKIIAKNIPSKQVVPNENDELVSVAILYRHGDRGPIGSYPNDPYHDLAYWPDGFGELTNKGKIRQFELGQWLRARYNNFLSENYSPKEILIVTSDVNRCHMSAQSNLAGLYTPTDDGIWLDDLPWEPIPIRSVPEEDDTLLAMSKDCPKFERIYADVENMEYFKKLLVQYQDMIRYIEEKVDWNITSVGKIETLHSVFYVYQTQNESFIPAWAYSLDPGNFSYLAGTAYTRKTFTYDLKRLHAGPFFNYLISYFEDVLNSSDTPKFLMLSGHDTTIGSVLNSMGVFDFVPPEFASTVIWELRKDQSDVPYLNMFYKKPSLIGLAELVLADCNFNCEFDNFKNVLANITIDEDTWEKECNS